MWPIRKKFVYKHMFSLLMQSVFDSWFCSGDIPINFNYSAEMENLEMEEKLF